MDTVDQVVSSDNDDFDITFKKTPNKLRVGM